MSVSSEYNYNTVGMSNGQKEVGLQTIQVFQMGSEIWNPNHSDKWSPFGQKPFEIQTKMFSF